MAEATEAQIRALQVLEDSWNDPDFGPALQRKVKAKFPDAKTNDDVFGPILKPVADRADKLEKELEKLREERAEERKASDEAKLKQTLDESLTAARQRYSLTEEGFDKMVARMKETGNYSDAEAAAAWVASKTPPAPVAGPSWRPQSMNLFGSKKYDEAMAELHRDPQDYMDSQLAQFVSDPDGYVAETFGGRAA